MNTFRQSVFPFSLSNCLASIMLLGILMPYLYICCQYLDFILDTIRLFFFIIYGTHQANAGSSCNLFYTAYSANSTKYKFFTSFNFDQIVNPFFHCTSTFQPLVVFYYCFTSLLDITNSSPCIT